MAYKQPIIVPNVKEYALISNFNKGYDTNTADGVISDNTFRDILNMTADENGNLKKRPGHKLSDIQKIIEYYRGVSAEAANDPNFAPGMYDDNILNIFTGVVNGVPVADGHKRDTLIQELLYMKGHAKTESDGEVTATNYTKLMALNILKDTLDLVPESGSAPSNFDGDVSVFPTLEFVAILGGNIDGYADTNGNSVWTDYRIPTFKYVYVKIQNQIYFSEAQGTSVQYWNVNYIINYDLSRYVDLKYKLKQTIYDDGVLKLNQYNNNIYFTTGYNLFKIDSSGVLSTISATNAFKPTAIEVSNVGFNILATSPLEWYDTTGTANVIKGIFFTQSIGGSPAVYEPIIKVPVNTSFRINVIDTGAGALGTPQYRPDNGEVIDANNPWIPFTGSYTGDVFTVTEFPLDGKFEIKITKGSGEAYRGYFETGNSLVNAIGRVSEIKNLINSSLYCTIIGSQLVLYGGHGYIFFSDYDNFTYFPNYYNIYAVGTADDSVTHIAYFRQYYAIFTKKLIKRMSGTFGSEDFLVTKLNDFVGCSKPRTIKQVENNLLFISNDGLYRLKQGYTGEGTENVDQVDLLITGDYNTTDVTGAIVIGTKYILSIGDKNITYDFKYDSFYKDEYGAKNIPTDKTIYSPILENAQDIKTPIVGCVLAGSTSLINYKNYNKFVLDDRYAYFSKLYNGNQDVRNATIVTDAKAALDLIVTPVANVMTSVDTIMSTALSGMEGQG